MNKNQTSKEQKITSLAALFNAFPGQDRTGTEKQLAETYLLAVEDIPARFVSKAVQMFVKGEAIRENHTFRPTPPELAIEARRPWQKHEENRLRQERMDRYRLENISDQSTEEQRRAVVKTGLGYNPEDGEATHIQGPQAFPDHSKKHEWWRDKAELTASARRLNADLPREVKQEGEG